MSNRYWLNDRMNNKGIISSYDRHERLEEVLRKFIKTYFLEITIKNAWKDVDVGRNDYQTKKCWSLFPISLMNCNYPIYRRFWKEGRRMMKRVLLYWKNGKRWRSLPFVLARVFLFMQMSSSLFIEASFHRNLFLSFHNTIFSWKPLTNRPFHSSRTSNSLSFSKE